MRRVMLFRATMVAVTDVDLMAPPYDPTSHAAGGCDYGRAAEQNLSVASAAEDRGGDVQEVAVCGPAHVMRGGSRYALECGGAHLQMERVIFSNRVNSS